MEEFDLVIVGAGWHGITMAKTYLEATADCSESVLILDEAASIGGCWAKERLYPGLKTNNLVGSYEFSDFPMDLDRYGMQRGQHIPGTVVHQYLLDAATRFHLHHRMRLQTKVTRATLRHDDQKWELDFHFGVRLADSPSQGHHGGKLIARKLVVATGVTSEPYMPAFPGQSDYTGNLFHAKSLRERSGDVQASRKVVVIRGNKSAMDVSYLAAASYGVDEVHLVMRPSGGGPSWMWWPRPNGLMRTTLARLTATRLFNVFDPNPFGQACSVARNFLHGTPPGRLVTSAFWRLLDRCVESSTGYTEEKLSMVRPWTSTFWMGNSLCINNYETDWFDLVRSGKVVVHHDVVSCLGKDKSLTFSSSSSSSSSDGGGGTLEQVDTIVCCTGWKSAPTIEFHPPISMGVPNGSSSSNTSSSSSSSDPDSDLLILDPKLLSQTTETIKRTIPILSSSLSTHNKPHAPSSSSSSSSSPSVIPNNNNNNPYRLYRFMIPPDPQFSLRNRNLAFTGLHRSIHAVTVAQAQSLWITAFFLSSSSSSSFPSSSPIPTTTEQDDEEKIMRETLLHAEYQRLRRPAEMGGGTGAKFPDLVFDSIPYVDMLLGDLGMGWMRKGKGKGKWWWWWWWWWGNVTGAYGVGDYKGLVGEWMGLRRREEEEEKGKKWKKGKRGVYAD